MTTLTTLRDIERRLSEVRKALSDVLGALDMPSRTGPEIQAKSTAMAQSIAHARALISKAEAGE